MQIRFIYNFARWLERRITKKWYAKARYVDAVLGVDWWLERRGLS